MHLVAIVFLYWLSLLCPSSEDARAKAELRWARGVAGDFLHAATGDFPDAAQALLTPELLKALEIPEAPHRFQLLDHLSAYRDPQITAEGIAPNRSEAVLSGALKSKRKDGGQDADFVLRLTRDSDKGKWSIRFIQLRPRRVNE